MSENTNSGFQVQESQKQSWLSIAAVWAGGMICVPSLMVGGVLSSGGLSLGQIVASILIGYGLICAYMIFIGMQACDTGSAGGSSGRRCLGQVRCEIYYQCFIGHCLCWLVRYSVCYLRIGFCFNDSRHIRL